MARLDVHAQPGSPSRGYVVDVQASILAHLGTRTVVPLVAHTGAIMPLRGLNPIFEVGGRPHIFLTQAIVSIPANRLGRAVTSLDGHYDAIARALDLLLTGF